MLRWNRTAWLALVAQERESLPRRKTTIMRTLIILAALGASLCLSSCNTISGAGKDVSSAGHAVTDTANDAKPH